MNKKLRIGLDIDDTIVQWREAHCKKFNIVNLDDLPQQKIGNQVYKCKNDKNFWENLELLEKPNFEPELYCTKRISSKIYTRNNLNKLGLPIKPIFQLYTQTRNKADLIKGKCDVLIDDSYYNVKQCVDSGFPALLIDRKHNRHINTPLRINNLNYKEIVTAYERNGFVKA